MQARRGDAARRDAARRDVGRRDAARRDAGRGFLLASAAGALHTANAAYPLAYRGRPAIAAWAAGLTPSELPLSHAAAHALGAAVALRRGAARTRAGRAGLALSATSAAALVALHVQARGTGAIVEAALVEALGADYLERIAHPAWPERGAPLRRQPGGVRMLRVRRRYAHDADLPYGEFGRANYLDIWRRTDLPLDARAPVLVQVHGGAWLYGNKRGQAYPLMSHLAERGWVCVSLNYRLSPRSTWPDQILDVKRAMAWVKMRIAGHGGDPGFVAITGGSAGGHLSALHALTARDRLWQPGFEEVDTSVVAAAPFYGVYDWTNRDGTGGRGLVALLEERVVKAPIAAAFDVFDAASPMSHVRADVPPFFVLHGTHDTLVPVAQARAFVSLLREASTAPVGYAEFPGAQHAFDIFGSLRADASARAVERFLGVVYGDHLREQARVADLGAGGKPILRG